MTVQADSAVSRRAGLWLDRLHPGPHKDKRIGQALGISPAMAKLLRRGRGWTVARIDQALGLWPGFGVAIVTDEADLARRLADVERDLADLKGRLGGRGS